MSNTIEIITRGIACSAGRILLCRNIRGGYSYLPGGHVEFGESCEEALRREFLEESGMEIKVGGLAFASEETFVAHGKSHHELNLAFHVELDPPHDRVVSLEPEIAFEWVDLASLANVDLRPTSTRAWLMSGGPQETQWMSGMSKVTTPNGR